MKGVETVHYVHLLHSYKCDRDIKTILDESRLSGYKSGQLYKLQHLSDNLLGLTYMQFYDYASTSGKIVNSDNMVQSMMQVPRQTHKSSYLEVSCNFVVDDELVSNLSSSIWNDVVYVECPYRAEGDYFDHKEEIIVMAMDDEPIESIGDSYGSHYSGNQRGVYRLWYRFLIDGKHVGYLDHMACKRLKKL